MDLSFIKEPITVVSGIVAILTFVGGLTWRRKRSGLGSEGGNSGSIAASITDSTVIQDSQVNIGRSDSYPQERDLTNLLKLAEREMSGNAKSTGYMTSELLTNALEELQRHNHYASLPKDLLDALDTALRIALAQNSIGQNVQRYSAAANQKNYISIAEEAAAAVAEYLDSIGRLKCSFKPVEINSPSSNRDWAIEITNDGDNPIVQCHVQLDDLWFVEPTEQMTLDRFPTSIPLRWIGSSNSRQMIAVGTRRRFELIAVRNTGSSNSIQIAYDEPDLFRRNQSLSYDSPFFMQLSVTSAELNPEFVVIKVDPPVVKDLILRGIYERDSEPRPPIEIVYRDKCRASRYFSFSGG